MLLLTLLHIFFVSFTDKPLAEQPALSPRAIEQRAKWKIDTDHLDYPVYAPYVDSLRHAGVEICHTSRWFNGATCRMSTDQAAQVEQWRFIASVQQTREDEVQSTEYRVQSTKYRVQSTHYSILTTDYSILNTHYSLLNTPYSLLNLTPLHQAGFEGQGILMAICDGGFTNANTLPCFRQELALGHFDFTDDADPFYGAEGTHGLACLSTISAMTDTYHGAAIRAQYYLMRSEEMHSESPKEMDNLIAALEKADSLGVNIFSVSLGYFYFDNPEWNLSHDMLDGSTTRLSIATTIAARKGMLVCVAAGNEAQSDWHKICVPADADSILSIGAVTATGEMSTFSSYGPSADGRVKPEVCAQGVQTALIAPDGTVFQSNGTSFAAPTIAGLAASLWSALPNENAMQIRQRIIDSSDRALTPDYQQFGYGIPNAWKAYTLYAEQTPSIELNENKARKIVRNGQILILQGEQLFTLTGQRVQ
ncbi:MAG: S8 family serine peptidase [Paludibacteraceae bacterium]|nr:S8 family serine peptidase [Paludibacteraceae bacterium]